MKIVVRVCYKQEKIIILDSIIYKMYYDRRPFYTTRVLLHIHLNTYHHKINMVRNVHPDVSYKYVNIYL